MMHLGPTELIIILAIVVILFGVGRISKIAGEMGSGIKAFKDGLQDDPEEPKEIANKPVKKDPGDSDPSI
jgi:sec-independent protein translocase protein TatA